MYVSPNIEKKVILHYYPIKHVDFPAATLVLLEGVPFPPLISLPKNPKLAEAMTHWHLKRVGTSKRAEVERGEGWMSPMVLGAFSNDFLSAFLRV